MKPTMLRDLLTQASLSLSSSLSSSFSSSYSAAASQSDSDSDSAGNIFQYISIVRSDISSWDHHTSISPSFLQATSRLHYHLLHLSSSSSSSYHAEIMIEIHTLLDSAMKYLEESLKRHLLSISAVHFPSDDKIIIIRSIVETMLSAGYGKECVSTYQSTRRSKLKSEMVRLRFDQSANQPKSIQKLKWEIMERQIKSWTDIAPAVVQSLFSNERRMCDEIFFAASTESVYDLIFSGVACDTALGFLSFPETVSIHLKPSPEKLFRLLDMYAKLSNLLPDIDSIFGSESTSTVRAQAVSSLAKLSEAIRVVLSQFELAIQKDPLKPSGLPGGAIHPLTRYVMNYLAYLSDFEICLHEILVDLPPNCNSVFFEQSNLKDKSVASVTIAWILFVLLCKIDSKAESYSDVALSYLFLVNNLQYIITKVQSCPLKEILGAEWMSGHNMKARRFMESHVRSGWAHLSDMLPSRNNTDDVLQLREFEITFDKALKERKDWSIADAGMREEVGMTVEAMLVPAHREWYRTRNDVLVVRYSSEDVRKRIMIFYGESNQI